GAEEAQLPNHLPEQPEITTHGAANESRLPYRARGARSSPSSNYRPPRNHGASGRLECVKQATFPGIAPMLHCSFQFHVQQTSGRVLDGRESDGEARRTPASTDDWAEVMLARIAER